MREIKFRAWDRRGKFMFLVREMFWLNKGLEVDDGATVRDCVVGTTGELMQYTGLKDKNGKEIYEGDILTAGYWGTVGYYGEDTFLVKLEKGAFRGFMCEYLKQKKERWSHSTPLYKLEKLEVIGNIYENPELLTTNS